MEPHFQTQISGEKATIFISGDIANIDVPLFYQKMEDLKKLPCEHITIDMSKVSFINSTGLGALIYTKKILNFRGIELCLIPSPKIEQVIRTCGIDNVIALAA